MFRLMIPLQAAAFALILALMPGNAVGQDLSVSPEEGIIQLTGGIGLVSMTANEFVFDGGWTTSQLIWESLNVPVATVGLSTKLSDGWTVAAKAEAGLGGNSSMADYDWLTPYVAANGPDDWTHRSLHPDTRVDHFMRGSLVVGRDMQLGDRFTINLNGGFKYTDVQWTGYGGSYIYSVGGFRDSSGNFVDGQAGITYRQMLPMAFVGADATADFDKLVLTAGAQGGFTFAGQAVDDHWLRDLRFVDNMYVAPIVALSANAQYGFSDNAALFVAASLDKMFTTRADTSVINTNTNATSFYANAAGADFVSVSISGGLTGSF